jgi:hypothetical protein
MKPMNAKLHPALKVAIAAAILLASGWLLLRRFQIGVEFSSATPDQVPVITTQPSESPGRSSPAKAETKTPLSKPDPAQAAAHQGSLRISNRSSHALRVALLSRQSKDLSTKSGNSSTRFAAPAHWDFEPGEGSTEGLVVSLPDREIKLKKGDVVVAFAEDGSQRYWGPFVVGETDRPTWNARSAEWGLVLEE